MFRNSPAMKFAIPFVLGIAAGYRLPLPVGAGTAVVAAAIVPGIVAASRFPQARTALLFVLIVAFGLLTIRADLSIVPPDRIERLLSPAPVASPAEGAHVHLWIGGKLLEEPHGAGGKVRFTFDIDSVTTGGRTYAAEGSVLVTAPDSIAGKLREGEIVRMAGDLARAGGPRN